MGDLSGKRFLLITYQSSVIVIGLENKLKELGCQVLTVGDDDSDLENYIPATDLFLYYLVKKIET